MEVVQNDSPPEDHPMNNNNEEPIEKIEAQPNEVQPEDSHIEEVHKEKENEEKKEDAQQEEIIIEPTPKRRGRPPTKGTKTSAKPTPAKATTAAIPTTVSIM